MRIHHMFILSYDCLAQISRSQKAPRRLITIGTSDRRWHGKWTCDYILSLRDLRLLDLVEDGQKDTKVFVNLSIEKVKSSFPYRLEIARVVQ